MLTFDMNTGGIESALDSVKVRAAQAIRPAAQAGAQVYYDAVRAGTPVSKEGHWFQGKAARKAKGRAAKRAASYWFESGNLKSAVYQVYSKSDSTPTNAEYSVAWNHRKAPYGFMVAGGTRNGAKANDFVGRAAKTVQSRAIEAMQSEFKRRVQA